MTLFIGHLGPGQCKLLMISAGMVLTGRGLILAWQLSPELLELAEVAAAAEDGEGVAADQLTVGV